jgi:hypothetical protein
MHRPQILSPSIQKLATGTSLGQSDASCLTEEHHSSYYYSSVMDQIICPLPIKYQLSNDKSLRYFAYIFRIEYRPIAKFCISRVLSGGVPPGRWFLRGPHGAAPGGRSSSLLHFISYFLFYFSVLYFVWYLYLMCMLSVFCM